MNRIGSMLKCDEEGSPGGFEKTHRTKPRDGMRSWKIKTPRAKKVAEVVDEEAEERIATLLAQVKPQAPTVVLPAVSAENPLKKEEIVKMNNDSKTPAPQPLDCLACFADKANVREKATDLFCTSCKPIFAKEAAAALKVGKLVTKSGWLAERMTAQLATLEQKLDLAEAEFNQIKKDNFIEASKYVDEKVAKLEKDVGIGQVDPEAREQLFNDREKELWLEKKGNAKYAQKMELKDKIAFLRKALSTIPKSAQPATPAATPASA